MSYLFGRTRSSHLTYVCLGILRSRIFYLLIKSRAEHRTIWSRSRSAYAFPASTHSQYNNNNNNNNNNNKRTYKTHLHTYEQKKQQHRARHNPAFSGSIIAISLPTSCQKSLMRACSRWICACCSCSCCIGVVAPASVTERLFRPQRKSENARGEREGGGSLYCQ